MNEALRIVAKAQREKTPWCERYIEFLQADLPKAITESVVFNIVQWQWKQGQLRTDRQYRGYVEGQRMSEEAFEANEANIMANKADDKILRQMVEFKEEHSLDMCEIGEQWFAYVTEGVGDVGTFKKSL
jgi:hypothetical protein